MTTIKSKMRIPNGLTRDDPSSMPQSLPLVSKQISNHHKTGPRSTVGNVSGYRCVSDCRSRGHEFDPGPVPYFRGD